MNKLGDEVLFIFDSACLWQASQRFLKSFVKCYYIVQCVLVLARPYHNVPNVCKQS